MAHTVVPLRAVEARPAVPEPASRRTRAADLDRLLHAWQSRFTAGQSPSTTSLVFLDWAAHALNAPFKTAELGRDAIIDRHADRRCARILATIGRIG